MNHTEKKSSNQNTNKIQLKLEDAIIGIRKLSWICVLFALVFGGIVFALLRYFSFYILLAISIIKNKNVFR